MKNRIERIVLGILLLSLLGAGTMTAAAATPGIYINGEDVTDQFTDDRTTLIGTYTADSTHIGLAKMLAEHYLPYLEAGLDVNMYYHGRGTMSVSITVPVTVNT